MVSRSILQGRPILGRNQSAVKPESDEFKEKALEIVSEYKNVGFLMLVDLSGPGIPSRLSDEPCEFSDFNEIILYMNFAYFLKMAIQMMYYFSLQNKSLIDYEN